MNYVNNNYIKPEKIEEIQFQTQVIKRIDQASGIIVAPTGSGKTVIALRLAVKHIDAGNVLYLAPTVVLVNQQYKMFRQNLSEHIDVFLLVASDLTRTVKFRQASKCVVFSTAHIIANDLKSGKINMAHISLIFFDQVHNVSMSYAYDQILKYCNSVKSIGLTASPGHKIQEITDLKNLLCVDNMFFVNPPRPISKVHTIKIKQHPEILKISKYLKQQIKQDLEVMSRHFKITQNIYELRLKILQKAKQNGAFYELLNLSNKIIKIRHLDYVLSTQDVALAKTYVNSQKAKAHHFDQIKMMINKLSMKSPKIEKIVEIVQNIDLNKSKGIIFTQYREIANMVC